MKILFFLFVASLARASQILLCESQYPSGVIKLKTNMNCNLNVKSTNKMTIGDVLVLAKNDFAKPKKSHACSVICAGKRDVHGFWGWTDVGTQNTVSQRQVEIERCLTAGETQHDDEFGRLEAMGWGKWESKPKTELSSASSGFAYSRKVLHSTACSFVLMEHEIAVTEEGHVASSLGSTRFCAGQTSGGCKLPSNWTLSWKAETVQWLQYVELSTRLLVRDGNTVFSPEHDFGLTGLEKTAAMYSYVEEKQVYSSNIWESQQGVFVVFIGEWFEYISPKNETTKMEFRRLLKTNHNLTSKHLAGAREKRESDIEYQIYQSTGRSRKVVTPAYLTTYLTGVLHKFHSDLQFQTREIVSGLCQRINYIAEIAVSTDAKGASNMARTILKRDDIFALSSGRYLAVYACTPLTNYSFPKRDHCYEDIPIIFETKGGSNEGFLDPVTLIVKPFSRAIPCDVAPPIFVAIGNKSYTYSPLDRQMLEHLYDVFPLSTFMAEFSLFDSTVFVPPAKGAVDSLFKAKFSAYQTEEAVRDSEQRLIRDLAVLHSENGGSFEKTAVGLVQNGIWGLLFGGLTWATIIAYATAAYVWGPLVLKFFFPQLFVQWLLMNERGNHRLSLPGMYNGFEYVKDKYRSWKAKDDSQVESYRLTEHLPPKYNPVPSAPIEFH